MVELLALALFVGLGAWRLASLLHTEGLFWCRELRERIGIAHDEEGYPVMWPDTPWGYTFHCFWCLSFLTATVLSVFVGLVLGLCGWMWVPLLLASSAVAAWLEKQVMRSQAR